MTRNPTGATVLHMVDALDELEQSVIGAVFLKPDNLALLPSLASNDFLGFKARVVWEAIRNLETQGNAIDTTTVGDHITHEGKIDAVGWDYIQSCTLRVPTIDNAIEYGRRIKDHALKNRLLNMFAELLGDASESTGAELLSQALGGLSLLDAEQPEQARTIGEVIKRRMAQLDEIAKQRALGLQTLSGYPTGIALLDEKMGGWQPGIVSLIAARPAMGKSSVGLATANACTAQGHGAHVFSLEDTESAYADRSMSRESGVTAESIRNCDLSKGQLADLQSAIPKIARRKNWLFDDRSGITAQEIVRSVRRHKKANGTKVVIVDYIQLLARTKDQRKATTHEVLTEAITEFATAAKQDHIAYVVMSQLNRDIEKREDRRPQLADLRESGSLEERSKCVVGVYRGAAYQGRKPKKGIDYPADRYSEPSPEEYERMVQLLVLKNSNGRTGTVRATWHGPTTRIE